MLLTVEPHHYIGDGGLGTEELTGVPMAEPVAHRLGLAVGWWWRAGS
jgi:hypothetical protein